MELNTQQISIILNVPFKTEQIPLDLDAIHHPELKSKAGLSKYPYITPNVKYTVRMMKDLTKSGYSKVISFFFDKKVFQKILYKYSRLPERDDVDFVLQQNPNTILQYNAMIMLKMIFPTYYPSVQNVTSSIDEYILQKGVSPSYKTLFGFNKMSYVKIDGKIHTIIKTVFLNDLLNHPVYKNVIKRSNEYFDWSKKQENNIGNEIGAGFEKLNSRIKGDLNVEIYKESFEKEYEKYKEYRETTRTLSKVDDDKRMFAETIFTLIGVINELYANKNERPKSKDIFDTVDLLYESFNNMKELYTRITGYNLLSKSPVEFVNRMNRLLEESKKLASISKIWKSYIKPRTINIRIEDENPEILSLLRSKYKPYIDYVDVIRTIIRPSRETSNTKLQECINNYSQNTVKDVNLTTIFQLVNDKYMFGNGKDSLLGYDISDEKLIEYMNVGVCSINMDEQNKPRYEIQVSMNLIETEYTMDSINAIKCVYDGFVLGKDLEDYLDSANPHEVDLHAIYISQSDIESQKNKVPRAPSEKESKEKTLPVPPPLSNVQEVPPMPPIPDKKVQFVGGNNTRKRRKTRRKTKRNRKHT